MEKKRKKTGWERARGKRETISKKWIKRTKEKIERGKTKRKEKGKLEEKKRENEKINSSVFSLVGFLFLDSQCLTEDDEENQEEEARR